MTKVAVCPDCGLHRLVRFALPHPRRRCRSCAVIARHATAVSRVGKPICPLCRDPRRAATRPRGLCFACYADPANRELVPSTSKYAVGTRHNFSGCAPMPEHPTDAAPGTEAKIEALEQRAKRKQALFHPDDNPGDCDHLRWTALRRLAEVA